MLDIHKLSAACKKYADSDDISVITEDFIKLTDLLKNGTNSGFFTIVPKKYLKPVCTGNLSGVGFDYKIKGLFSVGRLYGMDQGEFFLVHVFNPKDKNYKKGPVKVGIFQYPIYQNKKLKVGEITCLIPEREYRQVLNEYLNLVEKWINDNVRPKDSRKNHYEFNPISISSFKEDKCYPRYYRQTAVKARQVLLSSKTVKLSDVAEVLLSREDRSSNTTVKRVMPTDLSYPARIEKLHVGKPTSVKLQKGDIIFPRVRNDKGPLFFDIDTDEDIYAGPYTQVIRCHNIQPEYFYLYVTSDVASDVLDSISVSELTGHILVTDLVNLPIIKPVKDEKTYRDAFKNLFLDADKRQYTLEEIQGNLSDIDSAINIEDLLNLELASKIKVHNENQLRQFLTDDLLELKVCYEGKAYKATLILAGSILEAVLIDWLSEMKGVNYFVEEYPVEGKYQAQLIDYIDAIKNIKAPKWMEEARKAHKIREKRNLVHAKLCLKKSVEINDKTCRQVLQYLAAVLKTRGIEQGIGV